MISLQLRAVSAAVVTVAFAAVASGAPLKGASEPASASTPVSAANIPPLPPVLMGNNEAFNQAQASVLPMSPAQIKELRDRAAATMEAIHSGPPPKLMSPSISASFSPGAAIPEIRVAPGYVSSLQFIGSDGSHWPIVSAVVGNGAWFSVKQPASQNKSAPANVLTIGALTNSASTTLSILLNGAPSPVSVLLTTDPTQCDASATIRMDHRSPDAPPPVLLAPVDAPHMPPYMNSVLDGVPPQGAIALRSSSQQIQAWSFDPYIYVRTPLTVISPVYTGTKSSPDGTRVYAFNADQSMVLLVSDGGQIKQITLSQPVDGEQK
jgi:intracellular multiplication protein IcmK